jgi:hypothetical protein
MNLGILQSLPQGSTSFILVGLLIAVLLIAYKIMEMVFETLAVAGVSGAYYAGLIYLFNGGTFSGLQIDELLLFVFLGASLYLLYSLVLSVYSATSTLIEIPIEMAKIIFYPFKKLWGHHKKSRKEKKEKKRQKKQEKQEQKNEQSTKEVVLDNVKDSDEDDE